MDNTNTSGGDNDVRLPRTPADERADENRSKGTSYPHRDAGDPGTTGAADSGRTTTEPSGGMGTGGREGG